MEDFLLNKYFHLKTYKYQRQQFLVGAGIYILESN